MILHVSPCLLHSPRFSMIQYISPWSLRFSMNQYDSPYDYLFSRILHSSMILNDWWLAINFDIYIAQEDCYKNTGTNHQLRGHSRGEINFSQMIYSSYKGEPTRTQTPPPFCGMYNPKLPLIIFDLYYTVGIILLLKVWWPSSVEGE